jgi:hypothetical protein
MTIEETSTNVMTPVKESPDNGAAGDSSSQPAAAPAATTDGPAAPATPARRRQRFAKLWQVLRAGVGVWVGLFIAAAGFGLIAYTWSEVAALVNVALQVPYLLSGGFVGLGLVMLGLLVVNLAVKRKEAFDRHRQLEEVREALVRLREAIEGPAEDEDEEGG